MAYLSRKEVGTWYMLCMYLLRAILAALIFFFSRDVYQERERFSCNLNQKFQYFSKTLITYKISELCFTL